MNAAVNILEMGKNTKIVTIATTPKIELTTNTSPLIKKYKDSNYCNYP